MKLRKMISLTCVVGVVLSLVACGGKKQNDSQAATDTSSKKTQIKFWNHWGSETNEAKWFNDKIAEYEELNPDVEITQTNIPMEDYTGARLTTAFATGEGPDIFSASPGTLPAFTEADVLYDLSKYFSEDVLADFSEDAINSVSVDGKILAAPFEQDLLGLYYNKDMLDAAGITPPTTWDEMIAAAKALTTSDVWGITYDLTKGAYGNFIFMPFVWQTGGDFFEGDKSLLNTPEMIKALTMWKQMVDDGSANIKPSRFASDGAILAEGETAMWIGGSWAITQYEKEYPDMNIGLVPLPIPDGGKPASAGGGWRLAVSSQSQVAEQAAKFVQWLFLDEDPTNAIQWNTEVKFSYSPRKSVIEQAEDIYQKGLRATFTNEIYGTEQPELSMEPEVSDIIGDMLQNAIFSMSPEDAAKEGDRKLTEFFEN
ncbi:sugar ABC transporter substrate-binding protein [Muricomes intestini]|uniref:ABC transporter substrate-binding protein n=1 Tax=Muricomes intestini TaxID=1796634 RepID=UPI002FDD0CD3